MLRTITITDAHLAGAKSQRLDKLLATLFPEFSRGAMQRLVAEGHVQIDAQPCRSPRQLVAAGHVISADLSAATHTAAETDCQPEPIALEVVYEDAAILVVNKPAGMVVHPARHHRHGTLQAGVLHHHPAAAALPRGGLVHRLDKDTSGLLVVAKTAAAQKHLIAQFKTRQIGRHYLAVVFGTPPPTGVVDAAIARSRSNHTKMAVRHAGRAARTRFARPQQWRGFALLQCQLESGRTHQIRLHLEHAGYPIVGDPVYRTRARAHALAVSRQLLHAYRLHLLHPQNEESMQWECPPPDDMQAAIDYLATHHSLPPDGA